MLLILGFLGMNWVTECVHFQNLELVELHVFTLFMVSSSCFCPCYIAQEDLTEKILKQEDSFNDKNSESFKDQIIKQEGNFKDQIKKHEDNIEFLNSQSNRLTESVVDLQSMFRNSSMCALVLFPGIIHHFDL